MINAKNEIQYRLVTEILEAMAEEGFLTKEELDTALQLAVKKYRPSTVWELS